MAKYRVLIVDDHREIRRLLRSAIEDLSQDIEVIDIPSAEEAILIMSRMPIDLLLTDVDLPGISGLELRERSEVRNPNLKLVIFSGMTDPKTRQLVKESDADAFFFKPFDVGFFTETVKELLGVSETLHEGNGSNDYRNLTEGLAVIRDRVNAVAAILMDDHGIISQSGSLLTQSNSNTFLAAVVTTCRSAVKISQLLGEDSFRDLMFYYGQIYNVLISKLSDSIILLLVIESAHWEGGSLSREVQKIRSLSEELLKMPKETEPRSSVSTPMAAADQEEAVIDISGVLPELDSVFEKVETGLQTGELEAFWDSLIPEDGSGNQISRADAITYDQAQEMGLTPQLDQKKREK